jgi:hypothetical protein
MVEIKHETSVISAKIDRGCSRKPHYFHEIQTIKVKEIH